MRRLSGQVLKPTDSLYFRVVFHGFAFAKTGFIGFGIFIGLFGGCLSGFDSDLRVRPGTQ